MLYQSNMPAELPVPDTQPNRFASWIQDQFDALGQSVGARRDGETNDNARLQRAIDASYGGKLKIPAGTYMIDPTGVDDNHEGLSIVGSIHIEMDPDTILQCITQSITQFCMITIYNTSNVTITGGQIVGERSTHIGTTGEHGMGINIYHSTNVNIHGVQLRDHWGDCIYVGGRAIDGSMTPPSGILIDFCNLDNSRRQGISITISEGVTVDNCRITNINGTSPEYGIDIETNNPAIPCKNVTVSNSYFNGSAMGGFVVGAEAENINLIGNIFDGNVAGLNHTINGSAIGNLFLDADLNLRISNGLVVSGNVFDDAGVAVQTNGVADFIYNVTITDNVFKNTSGSTTQKGFTLTGGSDLGCFNLVIANNIFEGFISEAIYFLQYATNVSVKGNQIRSTNVSRWVMLLRLIDGHVSNNTIDLKFPVSAAINSVTSGTMVRGMFNNNNINWLNVTVGETIMSFGDYNGVETIGATISGNVLTGAVTGNPLKLPSTGTLKHKVMNNDFKFTGTAIQNGSNGHFLHRNIFSTTSENGGTLTYSGDGVATTKAIPHGLLGAPTSYNVLPANLATGTAGIKYVTADATNITVTFNAAPASGTNNIKLIWRAEINVFN